MMFFVALPLATVPAPEREKCVLPATTSASPLVDAARTPTPEPLVPLTPAPVSWCRSTAVFEVLSALIRARSPRRRRPRRPSYDVP